jgi:hypothetical protein
LAALGLSTPAQFAKVANAAVVALGRHQPLEDLPCTFCGLPLADVGDEAEGLPQSRLCSTAMGGCGHEQAAPEGGHQTVASPIPRLQYALLGGKLWLDWREGPPAAPIPASESGLSEGTGSGLVAGVRPMSIGGAQSEAELAAGPAPV